MEQEEYEFKFDFPSVMKWIAIVLGGLCIFAGAYTLIAEDNQTRTGLYLLCSGISGLLISAVIWVLVEIRDK